MTARELIEGLSGTLISDEGILSVQERELLATLLQRTHHHAGTRDNAVTECIARAVGEVIAERGCRVLGASIADRLLADAKNSGVHAQSPHPPMPAPADSPHPPKPAPGPAECPPGSPHPPKPEPPQSPHPPRPAPPGPGSPHPPRPGPKSALDFGQQYAGRVAVMERAVLPAQCVVLREFLAPAELRELTTYTLEHEQDFQVSEVISPGVPGGSIDFENRRSRVLMDLSKHQQIIVDRIQSCLPLIMRQLGRDRFEVTRVEAQITASNDGDYFRWHTDSGHEEIASRELTFVYFFHGEPKQFDGGELRIYDSEWREDGYQPLDSYRVVVPQQNQAVFFASSLAHEITKVHCPSKAFADSRFTINGWFHK